MNTVDIYPKIIDRQKLKENSQIIFRNRELIIEKEEQSVDNMVLRFKIGDGIKTYDALPYVSSLYSLFPEFCLCDSKYENSINIHLKED